MFRILYGKAGTKVCRNLISIYAYVICQMTSKIIYLFHIVKHIVTMSDIDTTVLHLPFVLCVVYDILYQKLHILSHIYHSKVPVSLQ